MSHLELAYPGEWFGVGEISIHSKERCPMGAQNSLDLTFYGELLDNLLQDTPYSHMSSAVSRDRATASRRLRGEGLKFLTVTLPSLGKAIDRSLETGTLTLPSGFKAKGGLSLPEFLHEAFLGVYELDGSLKEASQVSWSVLRWLRTVCYHFYKAEFPSSPAQDAEVLQKFKETDESLTFTLTDKTRGLLDAASYLLRELLRGYDPMDVIPRHGPGAVATGEKLDEKWHFKRLYGDLHARYPYYEYFIVGGALELLDRKDWYLALERLPHGTTKTILVPKDSRGKRTISTEPLEKQWMQQALSRTLVPWIESHPLSRNRVNFTHQHYNQNLAFTGSLYQDWATLDLSDASDRVGLDLVKYLFRHNEGLLKSLLATRSTHTILPGGEELELRKFAPMGSALCFPVEALVFWAVCVVAISRHERSNYREWAQQVYVYGDDIIVPNEHFAVVVDALQSVGMKVNEEKSYHRGFFRESCGVDAFHGVVVTPIRLRTLFSGKETDGSAFAAYVSLANAFESVGYECAASFVWKELERVYGKIPYGCANSSFPCRIVKDAIFAEERNIALGFEYQHNPDLQRLEFNVKSIDPQERKTTLDGWHRLLRDCVVSFADTDPTVNVLPRSLIINRGWHAV
jgi:hypothetical protein